MLNYAMRNVGMFDRSNILGYNRRILAPFSQGNILGLNTSFTHGTGDILSTVAGMGVGLGAQAMANSLNGQPNNMQFNQPFGQTNNQQYNQPFGQVNNQQYNQPFGQVNNQQYNQPFGQVNNQQFNQPFGQANNQQYNQPYTQPQNGFNNVTPSVGSPMNNIQPAYGTVNNATPITNYNSPPIQQNVQLVPVQQATAPVQQAPAPAPIIANKPTPALVNKVSKGSKTNVCPAGNAPQIKVCLGWHTNCCDVDVSAFMLGADEKSLGDDWFVFYGQPQSPDGALRLNSTESQDMQSMAVNFSKLNPNTKRIVFVLTINEALQKRQNFSMISDAYIRIMDIMRNVEIVSFPITEYYSTITSMMVGELYLHNGNWKFNAIGNGVARDLAGLCEFYGIETI